MHALIITSDENVVGELENRLSLMEDSYDHSCCLNFAIQSLRQKKYDYLLTDVQIPCGQKSQPQLVYTEKLLMTTRQSLENLPAIVLAAYNNRQEIDFIAHIQGSYQPVYCVRLPLSDYRSFDITLEGIIAKMRFDFRSKATSASLVSRDNINSKQFYASLDVEISREQICINGERVCSSDCIAGLVIQELMQRQKSGQYISRSGAELAEKLGNLGGQNSISKAVCNLRKAASNKLGKDVKFIENDRKMGYYLASDVRIFQK